MKKFFNTIKNGTFKGLKTGLMLLKIMLPIYLLVVLLKYSPIMPWLQEICQPVMKLFNLPGDAAVPIITGLFTDEYGCVAAMGGFEFPTAAITTIAMVNLMAHSIPVETAIAHKIGFSSGKLAVYRVAAAVLVGIFIGWLGGVFL